MLFTGKGRHTAAAKSQGQSTIEKNIGLRFGQQLKFGPHSNEFSHDAGFAQILFHEKPISLFTDQAQGSMKKQSGSIA